jgi:small-conductance mechanosensitive channel
MALADPSDPASPPFTQRHHSWLAIAASCLLLVLWILWAAEATLLFRLTAFAAALPGIIAVSRSSINHVLRPAGANISLGDAKTLDVVIFERGVRSLIIVAAALLLGRIFNVDIISLTMMEDTIETRLVRSGISIIVIVLAADFFWHVLRALIDRRLEISLMRANSDEDAGHTARLQTLLPIVSNILLGAIVIVTIMMALSAAGVEIGPLIASAGVVGVAIGFGAQTLVKDIISGIFYLLDDAFRIGEYIQSGSFKGTVESFSLRSVKLRHQRGALYTVPFGILGAVQNQSRDWVVDKIVMNVPYGTDLEKVRKIIKRIGETLAEDPEFGPNMINPLKMQGVVQFGDFAIQIQTKMMTKPGDVQFMARRRALLMINHAFAENGIGFAVPMVHVAGEGANGHGAAAQMGYDMLRQAKAE